MLTSARANSMAGRIDHVARFASPTKSTAICERKWKNICVKEICKTPEIFFLFYSILYLTSIEIIFTIYNFIYIVLITFAIETN